MKEVKLLMRIKVGTSQKKIDIPPGTPMGGYSARNKPSEGEHDPLHVKSLVISVNDQICVITSCDLVGLEKKAIEAVKARVSQNLNINTSNILISATHTHSGPRNIAIFGEPFEGFEKIYDLIEQSIIQATKSMEPATLSVSTIAIPEVSFNRRDYDPSSEFVDNECVVLAIKNQSGEVVCVAYNFANHPVVMGADNLLITADWVYYANNEIKNKFKNALPLFLQGSCGNLNPINTPLSGTVPKHDFDDCAEIGKPIGKAVCRGVEESKSFVINEPSGEIKELSIEADDEDKYEIFTFADGKVENDTFTVNTIVQAIAIGDIAFIGIPGEVISKISMDIKQKSPFANTVIIGYANDYIGYIPTRENYIAGGYEALMMSLSEEEGKIILDASIDSLEELKKK